MLQIGRSLVRSQQVSLEFFIDIKSLRSHYGPGVDSASIRNEYQEYFLGVKSGRYVRLKTLPPSCAVVMKSGNLNFLEPSRHLGPVMGLIYLNTLGLLFIEHNRDVSPEKKKKRIELYDHGAFLSMDNTRLLLRTNGLTVWRLTTHIWVVPHR